MPEENRIDRRTLRHALFQMLDGPAFTSSVIMAVPVGFPIVDAVYAVRERVPQEIGIIRRYVLDGICRFGPCSSDDLNELLGLGADVIERTAVELLGCVPGLRREGGRFAADSESRLALSQGGFAKIIEHQRKFLVNGLTDTLLPVDFWRHHEDWRLYPDPVSPRGQYLDASGERTEIAVRVRDRMTHGSRDLQRRIDSKDVDSNTTVGIPMGAFGTVGEPESVEVAWVTGLLLVKAGGDMMIVSPSRQPVVLLSHEEAHAEYLLAVCDGLRPQEINPQGVGRACEGLARSCNDAVEFSPGPAPGQVCVRLRTEGGLSERSGIAAPDDSAITKALAALVRGRHWDLYTRHVVELCPGDAHIAGRLAPLKAIRSLRDVMRANSGQTSGGAFDIAEWWSQWQARFIGELPSGVAYKPLPLESLVRAADSTPDTDFMDRLERAVATSKERERR